MPSKSEPDHDLSNEILGMTDVAEWRRRQLAAAARQRELRIHDLEREVAAAQRLLKQAQGDLEMWADRHAKLAEKLRRVESYNEQLTDSLRRVQVAHDQVIRDGLERTEGTEAPMFSAGRDQREVMP
jgi:predicted  nucleic acid-binding Zn-ribbon protein